MTTSKSGSSPLSRGIPSTSARSERSARIIPALAGNTTSLNSFHSPNPDHPRSRGEYSTQQTSTRLMHGSSPLSRGILPPVVIAVQPWGIIPALAGNTFPVPRWPLTCWDHPRSRGEYVDRWNDRVRVFGSSPLSRGILTPHVGRVLARRIIPALAGNTTAVT